MLEELILCESKMLVEFEIRGQGVRPAVQVLHQVSYVQRKWLDVAPQANAGMIICRPCS